MTEYFINHSNSLLVNRVFISFADHSEAISSTIRINDESNDQIIINFVKEIPTNLIDTKADIISK